MAPIYACSNITRFIFDELKSMNSWYCELEEDNNVILNQVSMETHQSRFRITEYPHGSLWKTKSPDNNQTTYSTTVMVNGNSYIVHAKRESAFDHKTGFKENYSLYLTDINDNVLVSAKNHCSALAGKVNEPEINITFETALNIILGETIEIMTPTKGGFTDS